MAARYAINLKDERIVYRSKATDAMPALYRWLPDDVAKGVMDGKIDAKKVVNVICKKMFADEDFDHSAYEEELKKLNVVLKEEEIPEPEEVVDTATDDINDSVSLAELAGAGAPSVDAQKAKATRKPKTAPSEDAPQAKKTEEELDI